MNAALNIQQECEKDLLYWLLKGNREVKIAVNLEESPENIRGEVVRPTAVGLASSLKRIDSSKHSACFEF